MTAKPGYQDLKSNVAVMMRQFGFRKTIWALEFIGCWALAVRDNNWQPIDAEEYAAYWKKGRAQGYRDQRRWRELFPNEPTPNERVIAAQATYEQYVAELGHEPSRDELAAAIATMPAA